MCIFFPECPRSLWMMDVSSKSRLLAYYLLQIHRVTAFIAPMNKRRNYFFYTTVICLVRGVEGGGVPLFGSLFPVIDIRQKSIYLIVTIKRVFDKATQSVFKRISD